MVLKAKAMIVYIIFLNYVLIIVNGLKFILNNFVCISVIIVITQNLINTSIYKFKIFQDILDYEKSEDKRVKLARIEHFKKINEQPHEIC